MEKKGNSNKLINHESIFEQLFVITLMFFGLFFSARISPLFDDFVSQIKLIINVSCIVCFAIGTALFSLLSFIWIKTNKYFYNRKSLIIIGTMFCIHYLIRVTMIGSPIQHEGLNCYESLKNLCYHPEILLDNFVEGSKLAYRIAIGYNFFALMGEFIVPGQGIGYQWVQLFLGTAAACCLYSVFRKLFVKARTSIVWWAAFVVSIQPMFLGMSTVCSLEYGIAIFFIFAFYCYLNRKYILMVFWLIMLGTTKGTGTIIALSFLGSCLIAQLWMYKRKIVPSYAVRKKDDAQCILNGEDNCGKADNHADNDADNDSPEQENDFDVRTWLITMMSLAAVALLVYFVVKICVANGIEFSWGYISVKIAQLYVLNFSWIWVIVIVAGIVMISGNKRVRKTHRMDIAPLFILLTCYTVYLLYLFAYIKAALPRYNMLADVLLVVFGVCALIKMFERRRAIISVFIIFAACMLAQAFVNIDPVGTDIFTKVNTNTFPIAYTKSLSKDAKMHFDNPGDYGYYNFQYSLVDRCVDKIKSEVDDFDDYVFVLIDDVESGHIIFEKIVEHYMENDKVILAFSPWCLSIKDDIIEALEMYYDISEMKEAGLRFSGSVVYYELWGNLHD